MSKKSLFAILIFALLCTGCENTLPLPDEYMRPLMVMNGLFTPDSLLDVQLTRSRSINEVPESSLPPGYYGSPVNPGKYPPVEDAEVRLYVDDVLRETLPHVGNGVYRSASFRPAEGQRIRVEAENAALGGVSGETALPRTVPIDSVTFGNMSLAYSYNIQTECSADGCAIIHRNIFAVQAINHNLECWVFSAYCHNPHQFITQFFNDGAEQIFQRMFIHLPIPFYVNKKAGFLRPTFKLIQSTIVKEYTINF